ncbi:MAG: DUF3347 domain-containing protein [Chitinophagaceae bacterium]|nr:DUF3347 domain-containing protein [Chitinophagaceae bacterium]
MKYCYFVIIIFILGSCNNTKSPANSPESSINLPSVTVSIPDSTNIAIDSMLSAYYNLKSSLVEADSVASLLSSETFYTTVNTIDLKSISDTSLAKKLQSNLDSLNVFAKAAQQSSTISDKRIQLNNITRQLYSLLQDAQYHKKKVYYQKCPMAFHDNEEGFWLSNVSEIENPYLGKKHPTYQSGMLHCGEVVDSIAYK